MVYKFTLMFTSARQIERASIKTVIDADRTSRNKTGAISAESICRLIEWRVFLLCTYYNDRTCLDCAQECDSKHAKEISCSEVGRRRNSQY